MDGFAHRLKYLRLKSNFSQADLSEKLGCTQQAIQRAEAGLSRQPRFAPAAAKLFGVSFEWLVFGKEEAFVYEQPPHSAQKVLEKKQAPNQDLPVLETSPGGAEGYFFLTGDTSEFVARPPQLESVRGAYALYVYDSSMEPRYFQGEIVYVHPAKPVREGDHVCVKFVSDVDPDIEQIGIFRLMAKDNTGVCLSKPTLRNEILLESAKIKTLDVILVSSAAP